MVVDSWRQFEQPVTQWPYGVAVDMKRIIDLLEGIDKRMGTKDCITEKKEKALAQLEARIRELELKAKD
ncbi:MAG: hypothetical protein ACYC9R_13270 [Nitrosotalea sp.]